jgi:hypothetical protein
MIGSTNLSGTPVTYTIRKTADATSYSWGVPTPGATIVAHPGENAENDTAILVLFDNTLSTFGGQISVKANNACSTGAARFLNVKPVLPITPGTINGSTDACNYIATGNDAVYSIKKINNADHYEWTVTNNTPGSSGNITITSHPGGNGANDTIIHVHFSSGYTTGTIGVKSVRNCGSSLQKSLTVITKKVLAVSTITGNATPCPGAVEIYTASDVLNASGYQWAVPANATILSGQGSNQITVQFPVNTLLFKPGNISVIATSYCGSSPTKTMAITKCTIPFSIKQPNNSVNLFALY